MIESQISEEAKVGRKKSATQFEEKIKQFLQDLEFNDVDGARDDFRINGIQVDVCGGWENALLVIECKTKQRLGQKSIRSAINEFRGKISLLQAGFKEHPKYSKYTFFKYIIVTKNIMVRRADYEFANQQPDIYIWNDDFLEYYSNLYSYIKPYAKYDLLGEMRIKPVVQRPITVPAFQVKFGNVNVYNFVMNPRHLLEIASVARRELRQERYYQRIIDKKRLVRIAEYVKDGGTFPNNIIISFREDLNVKFHREKGPNYSNTDWPYFGIAYGTLEFPKDYRSCWIIDGQHRLYAFINVENKINFNMPITAFEHLDMEEQCRFFLDINKNQKPVDPDLLWDLNGDMIPSEEDGIISMVAKSLNSAGNSPLLHKIYYPSIGIKKKAEKIKISALCIAIKKKRIVREVTVQNLKNPLYDQVSSNCVKKVGFSLSKYFDVLKANFLNNWELESKGFILTNGGIAVFIGLFEKILSRVMQKEGRQPTREHFEFYTTPLKTILGSADTAELARLRVGCASEGGRSQLLYDFVSIIRAETRDDSFGGESETTKLKDEFVTLEEDLKHLIKKKLYDSENKDWFKDAVDSSTYGRALNTMKKNGITDMGKIHLQIGLGDCFSIMRRYEDLFYPVFINEDTFSNKTIFEGAISTIVTMRAKLVAHYTGAKVESGDEQILRIELGKMNKCLREALRF